MIRLTLPVPPSVNALYRNVNGRGRVKTKAYKLWLTQADMHLLAHRVTGDKLMPIEGPCELQIRLPKIRGDVSNRTKAAEDYLVSRRITGDDKNNRKVTIWTDAAMDKGLCEITVVPV